jgi:hypothetical protein
MKRTCVGVAQAFRPAGARREAALKGLRYESGRRHRKSASGLVTTIWLAAILCLSATVQAEVLVRWDQEQIPPPESLGISRVVVPATQTAAVQNAIRQGYRVYVEVEASGVSGFIPAAEGLAGVVVKGQIADQQLRRLRQQFTSASPRVSVLEERGKWPYIRSNWVTRSNEVLQVSSRSAQPWIESNAALLRIIRAADAETTPLLTYPWKPITLSEIDEGPGLENYLVAIAEAGSFGGDLLLPLDARFEKRLLFGKPEARAEWNDIRRYMDFYSWNLAARYEPVANIGVVTAEPARSFEVMNLLARHNLPFDVIAPARLSAPSLGSFDMLIVLDKPDGGQLGVMAEFAKKGGAVVLADAETRRAAGSQGGPWRSEAPVVKSDERIVYRFGQGRVIEVLKAIADPNTFALEMRQILGRDHRAIDIWNGITVLAAPYREPDGGTVLVTVLNYAHQPLPVQLRIPGKFSVVRYESPEEPAALLPHDHRDGYTEFVLPALRIGGRVFLSN